MTKLGSLKTEKRRLDRIAADRIRSHILKGILPAEERLLETQLSDELEVSRGTVRAALAQLANEGLVHQVAFTRWEVSATSPRDAWEVYTLRSVVEGLGARLAAARITSDEAAQLKNIAGDLVDAVGAGRFDDATDLDFELHATIISLAQHKRLEEQHRYIVQQVRFHMVQSGFLPKDYGEMIAAHRELLEAVIVGDVSRAEDLARSHNAGEVELLARMISAEGKAQSSTRPASPAHILIAE